MLSFTLKRLVTGLLTVLFIATATFAAMHMVPGDPPGRERPNGADQCHESSFSTAAPSGRRSS